MHLKKEDFVLNVKSVETNRQTIDEYFLDIVKLIGSRGTCNRGKSGCVIVKDKYILSTGYVGSPKGLPHCDDEDHLMENNSCIRTAHAESNAICQAAKRGVSIDGATIYSTMFPCQWCAKMIINSGIVKVIAQNDYHKSKFSKEMFDKVNLEYVLINNEELKYDSTDTQQKDKTPKKSV